MAWIKTGDEVAGHPVVDLIGLDGLGALLVLAGWSSRYGTDGVVPTATATKDVPQSTIERLVKHRQLAIRDGGYIIQSELVVIKPAAEVAEQRAAWKARQDKSRRNRKPKVTPSVTRDNKRDSRCDSPRPIPDPDPDPIPVSNPKDQIAPAGANGVSHEPEKRLSPLATRPREAAKKVGTKEKAEPEPLAISIKDFCAILHERSGGKVLVTPFPGQLAAQFTKVLREAIGQGLTRDVLATVGEYVGERWKNPTVYVGYFAKAEILAGVVAQAIAWQENVGSSRLRYASELPRIGTISGAEAEARLAAKGQGLEPLFGDKKAGA
jgi:hypothetical protein